VAQGRAVFIAPPRSVIPAQAGVQQRYRSMVDAAPKDSYRT